jgi:hypothetical protein
VRHHLGLFPRDRDDNCYLCQAEKIIGFAGATPGRNIELDPTFSTSHSEERPGIAEPFGATDSDYEFGLTTKWGLTPNLILNATANPDFSQVEADAAQLDINTQWALWFDEKRPFFLEGTDLFSSRLGVVYTRTLADPVWGAKLTGKEGSHAIGAFVVGDNTTNFLFPGSQGSGVGALDMRSTGTVFRYRRDISASSTLGLFVTDREGEDYYNRVAALDGDFRLTSKDNLRFQVLGTRTSYPDTLTSEHGQPDGEFDGLAYDLFYFHGTRSLDWYLAYRKIQDGVRLDLGYRPQVNYDYYEGGWGYTWNRSADHWYTMLNVGSGYEYEVEEGSGDLINKGFSGWFDYEGPMQSYFHAWGFLGTRRYEGLEFDNRFLSTEFGLRLSESLDAEVDLEGGRTVDYDNARQGTQITVEP